MNYGHFSENGREYVITRPDTPRPWVNILTNGSYSAVVSQTGGGYSFIGGPGYDRITRADPDSAQSDRPGRYIFIRDNASTDFWSVGWQPVRHDYDWFECRHGLGETTVASTVEGIVGRITYFVPLDDNLEIWRVKVENTRKTEADLSVFAYVEWTLGTSYDDLLVREVSNTFNESGFQDSYVYATKHLWRRPDSASVTLKETKAAGGPKFIPETLSANQAWGKWAFIAMGLPVEGFDCSREAFLGQYGDITRPEAVTRGTCSNSDGDGRDVAGALSTRLTIPAGGSVEFDVFVGVTLHKDDPSGVVARYTDPGIVDEKLTALRRFWDGITSKVTVDTPDAEINRAVNIWDKYGAWISSQTHGLASPARDGASVVNFRETCYDILGILPMDPYAGKLRLVEIIQHQHRDGSAVHNWEPRSDVGTRTGHLDDAVWLIFAVTSYLKETGDLDFLNDRTKYYYSQSPASIYEHMIRAIEFLLSQMSPRGLSLVGPGDWNDDLDQAGAEGVGESVLTSMMAAWALSEAAVVATLRDDRTRARVWNAKSREISRRINTHAWDGAWYLRATDDRKDPIGSGAGAVSRLYLLPQIWSIISGAANPARTEAVMASVRDRLRTDLGPTTLDPPYVRPDRHIGTITRYRPGLRDNGGISTISGAWLVMTECILGGGARAHAALRELMPSVRSLGSDYDGEPYTHVEFLRGPGSGELGRSDSSWPPGVASWVWRMMTDWILGVRPDYPGLRIDPCVPPDWREFSMIRPFREAIYRIAVHNPTGVERGVRKMTVDGKTVRHGHAVPDFQDMKVHEVTVEMG